MPFRDAYEKTMQAAGCYIGSQHSDQYVHEVESAIDSAIDGIKKIVITQDGSLTNKDIHYVKGDMSELWHAGTFNIYSVAKGLKDTKASAPRNHSPVDAIIQSPIDYIEAQLKYYKTPMDTAKAISDPKFFGLEKVVPSDQLEGVRDAAFSLYRENLAKGRTGQASQYLHTYEVVSDRLKSNNGAESKPLSEGDALALAKRLKAENSTKEDFDKLGLTTKEFIDWSDIAREAGTAALNAAIITAVLKAAPHIMANIKVLIDEGEIDIEELKKTGLAGLNGFAEGALRGGIAAGLVASCRGGLLGEALKGVNPSVIAAATVVAMNAMHNSIGVYQGKMTKEQFAEACLRDTFVVGLGMGGAVLGQALIPIPILGAILGNFIGSTCAVIVFEGGKIVFLSFFIESGISFFNIVKQDYELPRDILEQCGFSLIDFASIDLETVQIDTINLDIFEIDTISIRPVRRGLIEVNAIGYV